MADLTLDQMEARLARVGGGGGTNTVPVVEPTSAPQDELDAMPEFGSLRDSGESGQSFGDALLPASQETLRRIEASQLARPVSVEPSKWQTPGFAERLGARKGVPFDTQTGVPFMDRLRAAAQPTKEEEQRALEAAYGQGKVRRNSFGDLVVTTKDEQGREVDKLADPIGLDVGDAASVLAQLPEIGGAMLATIRSRGLNMAPGIWNAAKTLLAMVGGTAAGGVTKDVAVRAAEGEPIQPSEIATRRGEEAAVNAGLGVAGGVAAKVGGTLFSPFSQPGPLQFKANEAQQYFADKYGLKLPMSPAESTGSSFLQRAEAMESQKPGASVAFEKLWKKRDELLTKLQQIVLGGGAPDEEEAGKRAIAALGAKTSVLSQNVEQAASEAAQAAEGELRAGVGQAVDKAAVGKAIDLGAKARRSGFEMVNQANYDAFFSNPLAKAKVVQGQGLKNEVDAMLGELQSVQKQVQRPTGVIGPNGQPVMQTVTVNEPVSTPVRPRLEELSVKLEGGKVSINDLKQIRTDVDNAIKTGEAIPGVKEGRLKHLYSKITDAIDQGLQSINDPQLSKAWRTANDYYKANVGKFERAGIAELFRDPINAMGPHELVERAVSSPDTYNAYKEFFGANSVQMRGVRQAIRDDTLGLSDLSPSVGAAAFVRRLEALPAEVRKDVFGASAGKLRESAQALRAAGGETLPASELNAMLRSGNVSAAKVEQMITLQRGKDEAYRNELVRAMSEGNLKPDTIKPTELVDRMVFSKRTQPSDLKEVTALLADRPDVLEDVRRLTFKRALDDATTVNPTTGRRVVTANDLEKMLADENLSKRLETVLGPSTFEDLTRLKDFLKPGSVIQQAAKSAGGLSTGQQVAGLVERGALKYVDRSIKNFFLATAYTSPPVKAWIANTILKEQGKANLVNYVVASTPFLEAVAKVPSEGAQRKTMYAIKGSIDRYLRENPSDAATEPAQPTKGGDIPWDQFLQRIGAPPQQQ